MASCFVESIQEEFPANNDYIRHFKITWNIENFLSSNVRSALLKSPKFSLDNLSSWFLTLEPQLTNKKAVLHLHRIQKDEGPQKICVNFRFGLKEENNEIWFTEFSAEFEAGTSKSENRERLSRYFKNNQPVVLCQMMIVKKIPDVTELYPNSTEVSFMSDFYNLNETNNLSDFILQVSGKCLKVHKAILTERSRYFWNLFFERKYKLSFIKLSDVHENAVKSVLALMYSGNICHWSEVGDLKLTTYDCVVKFDVVHLRDLLAPTEIKLVSQCSSEVVDINWEIKRFSYKLENYVLRSPTFETGVGSVRFRYNTQSPAHSDSIRIYTVIEPLSPNKKVGTARLYFSILDSEKNKHNEQTKMVNLDKAVRTFFKIDQPLLLSMKSRLLPEDVLAMCFQIETPTHKPKQSDVIKDSVDRDVKLQCFSSLLANTNFSDFTLLAGDQTFKVHKAILAARSKFFQELFATYKKDNVTILDLRPDTLKILLSYVYSGKISELDIDSGLELKKVSDKYSVTLLNHLLSEFFESKCNPNDVCELVLKADAWKVEDTKDLAVNYLILHFNNIQETETWKYLLEQNNELASEILFKVSEDFFSNFFTMQV